MIERPPESEFSESELALIEKLREKGPDDPEAHEMFLAWQAEEMEKAEAANTSRANIEVVLKQAKIFRAAGVYESAWEELKWVREAAARDANAKDLYDQAMAIMDEIDEERERQDSE